MMYTKDTLKDFITDFEKLNNHEKYATLVKITSQYYDVELNGIHIEGIQVDNVSIKFRLPNNRWIKLRTVEDLKIRLLPD